MIDSMLLQAVIEAIFGGFTGYITNRVAIGKLFREGGIIEKTRDQFTYEISELLESSVLTQDVLRQCLSTKEATAAFCDFYRDILQNRIAPALGTHSLYDLDPDFAQQCEQHLQKCADAFLTNISYEVVSEDMPSLIAKAQQSLLQKLQSAYEAQVLQSDFCDRLVSELLQKYGHLSPNALHWQPLFAKASLLTPAVFEKLPDILQQDTTLLTLIDTYFSQVFPIWQNALSAVGKKTPAELIGSEEAFERLLEQLSHDLEFRSLLQNILSPWQNYVKLHDQSLIEWLNTPQAAAIFAPVAQQQWPVFADHIARFVLQNRYELTALLQASVHDALSEQEHLEHIVLSLLSGYTEKLPDDELHAMIHSFLLQFIPAQEAYDFLLQFIPVNIRMLTLQEISQKIQPQAVLSFLQQHAADFYSMLSARPLSDFIDLSSFFCQDRKNTLVQFTANAFSSASFCQSIILSVQKKRNDFAQSPLQDSLRALHIGTDTLAFIMRNILSSVRFTQIIQTNPTAIRQAAQDFSTQKIHQLIHDAMHRPLAEYYQQIITPEKIDAFLPQIHSFCTDSVLLPALKGNLSLLAQNSLQQLSNQQMRALVDEFMGKNLRWLNWLGAGIGSVVGGIAGSAIAAFPPLTGSLSATGGLLAGKCALFGAVGYATNCLAIRGLFRPYQKHFGIQGIIPKNQAAFSVFLGNMVDRYVLNQDGIDDLFTRYEKELPLWIRQKCSQDTVQERLNLWIQSQLPLWQQSMQKTIEQYMIRYDYHHVSQPLTQLLSFSPNDAYGYLKSFAPAALRNISLTSAQLTVSAEFCRENLLPFFANQLTARFPSLLQRPIADIDQNITFLSKGTLLSPQKMENTLSYLSKHCRLQDFPVFSSTVANWSTQAIDRLLDRYPAWIEQSAQTMISFAQQKIRSGLNMLQSLAYFAANGNRIVEIVLSDFLYQKMPLFLSQKKASLAEAIQQFLFTVSSGFLYDLGLGSFQPWCMHLERDENFHSARLETHSVLMHALQKTSFEELQTLFPLIRQTLQPALFESLQLLYSADDRLAETCSDFCSQLTQKLFSDTIRNDILSSLEETRLIDTLLSAETISIFGTQALMQIWQNFGSHPLQDFLPATYRHTISRSVPILLQSSLWRSTWNDLRQIPTMPQLSAILSDEPWVDSAISTLFSSLQEHAYTLLTPLDLNETTARQVACMSPKKLEALVYGFANHYFIPIQNMGWLGAIFALPGSILYWL